MSQLSHDRLPFGQKFAFSSSQYTSGSHPRFALSVHILPVRHFAVRSSQITKPGCVDMLFNARSSKHLSSHIVMTQLQYTQKNKHIKFIKHQRLLVYYSKPTFTSDGHVGVDYAGFYGWKVAWMNNQFSWGSAATDLRWGGQFNSIFGERNIQIRQHLTKWKQSIIYRQNRRLGWRLSQSMMPLWLPTEVDVSTCSLPSKPSNAEYVETARSWRRRTDRCRL